MNISDEAVESAAKAMWARVRVDEWEGNTDYLAVEVYRHDARIALEAASPHLMAQAWDEGKGIGQSGGWNKPNPYRSAGAGE